MSKSLKNYISIREVLQKHSPEDIRMVVCSTHYRKDIEYGEEIINNAARRVNYLYSAMSAFYNMEEGAGGKEEEAVAIASALDSGFKEAMDDDFNTPLALSKIEVAVSGLKTFSENNGRIEPGAKRDIIDIVRKNAGVLGLLEKDSFKEPLPEDVKKMMAAREEMRRNKRFKESDDIRERVRSEYGIELEDTEHGTVWSKRAWRN